MVDLNGSAKSESSEPLKGSELVAAVVNDLSDKSGKGVHILLGLSVESRKDLNSFNHSIVTRNRNSSSLIDSLLNQGLVRDLLALNGTKQQCEQNSVLSSHFNYKFQLSNPLL